MKIEISIFEFLKGPKSQRVQQIHKKYSYKTYIAKFK